MSKLYFEILAIVSIVIFLSSCSKEDERTPEQMERDLIMATEDILRSNYWGFYDMKVTVQYESKASPLLVNVADENGMVQPGTYDSYDIFGDNKRQLNYTYSFTRDDILNDTIGEDNFFRIGGYYVLNTTDMRISLDTINPVKFDYQYSSENNRFAFNTDGIHKDNLLDFLNNSIIGIAINERPGQIADAFVEMVLENEKVSEAVHQYLYDFIHGKVEGIQESPEKLAEVITRIVINKLSETDFESILYDKILQALDRLQTKFDNPEEIAADLAKRFSEKIEAAISEEDIYNIILPRIENFENETLPVISEQIANMVFEKISEKLSEENVYNKIYPLWESVTQVDTATVEGTANKLSEVVTAHFFDAASLTQKMLPFVTKIDETSTIKLSSLAQEIIDDVLIPSVDKINERFPGLLLEPDWESIKPYLTSALTGIKAGLKNSTVEDMSAALANTVIGIMDLSIQKGFEKAMYRIQQVPPDQVASYVSSWVANLVDMAEQPIVDLIEEKLNTVFDKFESDKIAEELSQLIHSKVMDVLSEEQIYQLILPVMEAVKNADIEKIADKLADLIIEMGVNKVDKEQLVDKLTEVIEKLIGKINPDEVSEKLANLIIETDLVQGIDGYWLAKVIEIKTYQLIINVARNLNSVENIEIVIQVKEKR